MPCTPSTNRSSSTGPDQSAAPRNERGCLKRASNSVTLGTPAAYTVPVEPSAQSVGIEPGSVKNDSQRGNGAAAPTQVIACVEAGSPVAFSAGAPRSDDAMF